MGPKDEITIAVQSTTGGRLQAWQSYTTFGSQEGTPKIGASIAPGLTVFGLSMGDANDFGGEPTQDPSRIERRSTCA
jgi:hypothetical protein